MSVNTYQAEFATQPTPVPGQPHTPGGTLHSYRYLTIVTDTLQNAMSIARTKVRLGETLIGVRLMDMETVVDASAIKDDD